LTASSAGLADRLAEEVPTIVGIDHGFSFPLRYFEVHQLEPDWPKFLEDFQRHWPTDAEHTYVDFVRDGLAGNGAARAGNTRWRRMTEQRAGSAKSVFHFDVQGSVAKSTHAGIPWLLYRRRQLGSRLNFWPFDGWSVPAGKSAVVEVYPSLWKHAFPADDRTPDQHDAYAVASWLSEADRSGQLERFLQPNLTLQQRMVAGGPAGRAILSHWSVMTKNTSQIFAAGPPVVERSLGQRISKEELGGHKAAADIAGLVHNVAADEAECFSMIRRYLSYMPSNVWDLPPVVDTVDSPSRRDEALATIVPKDRRKPYNMRDLVQMVVDKDSVFEIQPSYGKAVITSLARMNGKVVGIIANNPMIYGGALDLKAAAKQTHFIQLCDTFHIPLIFLVDVPGFMVGQDAELAGTLREGMRSVYVAMQATVPILTVVIRKCY
jgi:hypothetical protein